MMTTWGLYSFMLLYGNHPFARNWLYWQDAIELFNESNPSGGVTSLEFYRNLLTLAVIVGVLVSVKRFWIGLIIGRNTYSRYAGDLAAVMEKVLLVGQVAELARDVEHYGYRLSDFQLDHEFFKETIGKEDDLNVTCVESPTHGSQSSGRHDDFKVGQERVFGLQKDYSGSAMKVKINMLLGEWEEPTEIRRCDVSK
jgi:hypothetical protein